MAKSKKTDEVTTTAVQQTVGERTPAPERFDGESAAEADKARVEEAAAARGEASTAPDGEASTSAEPPVKDPERALYGSTREIGYKPRRMAKDPNDEPEGPDRKFDPATKARWPETPIADLRREVEEGRKAREGDAE